MKPLTPSFTCLFHFANSLKQPWIAANILGHNKNMLGFKVLWCHFYWQCTLSINRTPGAPFLCCSFPLVLPFIICLKTVLEHSLSGSNAICFPLLSLYACTVSFIFYFLLSRVNSVTPNPFSFNVAILHVCFFIYPSLLWRRILTYCSSWHFTPSLWAHKKSSHTLLMYHENSCSKTCNSIHYRHPWALLCTEPQTVIQTVLVWLR